MNPAPTPPRSILSEDQFTWFRDLIEQRCGIHIDESQKKSFQHSLRVRMERLGLQAFLHYYERVADDACEDELRELVNLVTINETYFFRDPTQFQMLRTRILPLLLAERSACNDRRMRIWSAGCSTGEEPYSVALLLRDWGIYNLRGWTFEIIATDVNTEALDAARRGIYSRKAVRNVEAKLLERYFTPEGDRFRLSDAIKSCVQFRYLNLMQDPLPPRELRGQDIIFCKNVAIYFSRENTRRLMSGFFETLNEGGHLFLGHSESLWQLSDQLRLVEYDGNFCYRKVTVAQEFVERRSGRDRRAGTTPPPGVERRLGDRRQLSLSARHPEASEARIPPSAQQAASEYDGCLELFRSGAWEQAETSLKALIDSSPTFIRAYILLSVLYANRACYDQALEQAHRALQLEAMEAKAHFLVGMIESLRGREEAALQSMRRALYLDSSLLVAHFYLANLHRKRGESDQALREYRNVIDGYQRHAFEWPEEFAAELTLEQVVQFSRRSVQLLTPPGDPANGRIPFYG